MAFDAATLDRVDGLFNAEPYFNPVSLDPNVPADLRVVAYGGSIWQSAGGIASDG